MSKIEINNVYKIFGNNPMSVLPRVKEGATKEEILEKPVTTRKTIKEIKEIRNN